MEGRMTQRSRYSRRIDNASQLEPLLAWVRSMAERALQSGALQVDLCRPGKSRLQEEKYHSMIEDIRAHCFRGYSRDGMKAALVNQFALERERNGEPLSHPGEQVWDWVNQARVYVRPSTKKFRKQEAADFIEFLYATGSEFGVRWSEKALAIYDETMRAKAA
jgi:hypothetical protein